MEQRYDGDSFHYTQALCHRRGQWLEREPDLRCPLVGRFVSRGGFSNRNQETCPIPHVVEDGHGTIEQDGRTWDVAPGDCFVIWPGRPVSYADRVDSPWRYTWFRLAGAVATEALQALGMSPETPHYPGDFRRPLLAIADEIYRLYAQGDNAPITPMASAWRVLAGLEAVLGPNRRSPPSLSEQARHIIQHQFGSDLAIDDLARQLGVNRVTLFRQFRDSYGTSPKQYLMRVRLDRARILLRANNEAVHDVARACGFPNAHYFARAFGADTGMTPSEWRKRQHRLPG